MNTRIDPSTGLPGATPRLRALRTSPVRRVLALTAVGAVAVTLAACGSSSSASTTSTTAAAGKGAAGAGAGTGTGGTTRRFPGTSGTIAAINGTSLEVQSPSSQTTVNYTSTTTFQQTVSATAADVTVGSCISAFGAPSSGASSSTTRAFGEPVTATTVTITQPTSGSCTAGFGGGGGGGAFPRGGPGAGGGTGGGFPPGGTGTRPSGGAGFRGGNFGAASGAVTSVSGDAVTISEKNPRTAATSSVVVTLTSATTFTQRTTASSSDLAVGKCANAFGPADSTGAVTASSITISTPGPNGCTSGFGFRGAGAGAPGAAAGGSTGA